MAEYLITLKDLTDVPKGLVGTQGPYSYWSRRPSVIKNKVDMQRAEMNAFKDKTGLLAEFRKQFEAEYVDYCSGAFESNDSRYIAEYGCNYLIHDRFDALEQAGIMSYSKSSCFLYTLHDKLDYALAYMFNAPLETIRENLKKSCKEYNIDYLTLSYAFTAKDKDLLEKINLGCLVGVSPTLDASLLNIIESKSTCKICLASTAIDLAADCSAVEDRITAFIIAKVGYFIHIILNLILQLYENRIPGFIASSARIPVSIGRYCMTVASDSYDAPEVVIDIENIFTMRLPVRTYKSLGVYYESDWYAEGV